MNKRIIWPLLLTACLGLGILIVLNTKTVFGTPYQVVSPLALYDASQDCFYEFSDQATKQAFIAQAKTEPTNLRIVKVSQTLATKQSSYLMTSMYGGPYGGRMSIGPAQNILLDDFRISINQKSDFPLPQKQFGNVILQADIAYTDYRLEQQGPDQNWTALGTYTMKELKSYQFEPQYWN